MRDQVASRLVVATDFSPYPAGRFEDHGPYSGERFRREVLLPRLREAGCLVIILDGAEGYGSSFLEEAFGGLVRKRYFTPSDLRHRLVIVSDENPALIREIWGYISEAEPELHG